MKNNIPRKNMKMKGNSKQNDGVMKLMKDEVKINKNENSSKKSLKKF